MPSSNFCKLSIYTLNFKWSHQSFSVKKYIKLYWYTIIRYFNIYCNIVYVLYFWRSRYLRVKNLQWLQSKFHYHHVFIQEHGNAIPVALTTPYISHKLVSNNICWWLYLYVHSCSTRLIYQIFMSNPFFV